MVYITGDVHGNFTAVEQFCAAANTTKEDILIILGDAGINYFGTERDRSLKTHLAALPVTMFCLHGNHEQRPESIGYGEAFWHGGAVFMEPKFPNLLFAKDGEIYTLAGKRCIAIGGAYSVDKKYRIARNMGWWPDEQPSGAIKARVEQTLCDVDWCIDTVLSHTCPLKYEPREVFIGGIDQSTVDKSTEEWLDGIEDRLDYRQWYCGHFHTDKSIDRMRFMFREIRPF